MMPRISPPNPRSRLRPQPGNKRPAQFPPCWNREPCWCWPSGRKDFPWKQGQHKGRGAWHDNYPYVLEHLAYYLTWLEVVRMALNDLAAQVINPDRDTPVDVDLVLDIGNSRTTGILVETLPQRITNLNDSYLLELRDLSQPEHIYADPFETRVEFVDAAFGNDAFSRRSGRLSPAFAWPSSVRIGPEAARVATQAVCAEGTTGMELAPRLELEDRARLIGLVWDNIAEFTAVYEQLASALRQLGNPTEASCGIEALVPRDNSIIDVELLQGLNKPSTDLLTVVGAGGRKADLPRALVTALTAEITIHMLEKPDDFFDHTDLLDFPGYRTRYSIPDLPHELAVSKAEDKDTLKQLFLRGKVAYLFERYREEKELTSMLLCIDDRTQEVQDLPQAVYEWICSTHGETPEMRAGKPAALFFVLTKMDTGFEKKVGADSVEKRWTIRLESSLLKFFAQLHDWPLNWDGTHPFNNVFLLRNPNVRCEAIFDYSNSLETGVRETQQNFVEEVHQAFLQSPLVQRHETLY